MKRSIFPAAISALLLLGACKKNDDYVPPAPQVNILKAAGNSAEVLTQLEVFRLLLGDSVNNAPGKIAGRREVNWDGAPAAITNNSGFPLDFFNITDPAGPNGRKRGLVYLDNGFAIRLDSSSFVDLDPSYADEFVPFSQKKSIIAVKSTNSEIGFKIAGTNSNAFVHGFGLIFLDVEKANSTYLEFFSGTKSLGSFAAPASNNSGGFSFLGVHFPNEKITRVKIIAGEAPLAAGIKDISDGGTKDLVAYDDFFYDEPKGLQ